MAKTILRTQAELSALYDRHKDMVYRVCFAYMKNPADTEDVVQETFIRLIQAEPLFENAVHEKAWLIRTATNICKNHLRHWWHKRTELTDEAGGQTVADVEGDEVLQVVMGLPDRYKTVVYLYYYEGYNSAEIARMLQKPQSTIRNHLHEARKLLRKQLGEV